MERIIKAKVDFLWFTKGQIIQEKEYQNNWEELVEITDDNTGLDLNNDGVIDKKDSIIASKVMNKVKETINKKKK